MFSIYNNFIIPKILGHENCENFSSQNYENYFIKLLRNSFNSNLQISPLSKLQRWNIEIAI